MDGSMDAATEAAVEASLDRAAAVCARRGAQLTALRRQVLRLVLAAEQPLGAYALLERLRSLRAGAAPPTVYRALDFLLEHGLVHRIERLSAYIGCIAPEPVARSDAAPHSHPHQFLICGQCGGTTELSDAGVEAALAAAAAEIGFALRGATVEAVGVCARCVS